MSEAVRYEARGVRCLECRGLDLKRDPEGAVPGETAKAGFGWCSLAVVPHYVSVAMARNCMDFDPAPAEQVAARDAWAEKLPRLGQRK